MDKAEGKDDAKIREAVKRRKVLESLKEKAQQQFNWEEVLKEQHEIDEWASINHQASQDVIKR